MKTIQMIASALALTLPLGALAADAQPTFLTPARSATPRLGTSSAIKPALAPDPAARVSEMRAVPGPDGKLHIVCHDIPNPKLQAAKHAEHPTP